MAIRILLVDDETLVRQGIRKLLELDPRIAVVAEAADGEDALRLIAEHRPAVVLLDVRMPKLDGIGVLRALRDRGAAPPCLVLTTFDDRALALEAIRHGARGYLRKDVTLADLLSAITTLADGGTHLQPVLTAGLLAAAASRAGAGFGGLDRGRGRDAGSGSVLAGDAVQAGGAVSVGGAVPVGGGVPAGGGGRGSVLAAEPLTQRETAVLRLMAAAYTNREIGQALGAAEATVKVHVSNILAKLGARDRTHAVLSALESRLL